MRIQEIDNSFRLSQTILWQYDHAPNLICMFAGMANELKMEVTDFWDWFVKEVGNVDEADFFGLNVWGITLGVPRPYIPHGQITTEESVDEEGNAVYALSDDVYRRILKARMYMLDANASTAEFAEGLRIAFEGRVGIVDGSDGDPQTPMAVFYTNNLSASSTTFYCFAGKDGERLYSKTSTPTDGAPMLRDKNGVFTDAGVAFDAETMEREQNGDVQSVTFGTPLIDEPASQDMKVEWEEYDLLSNPDLFEQIFPYPSGVKTPGGEIDTSRFIGLNETQADGQKLMNFSPKHADASDESVNGGQFGF